MIKWIKDNWTDPVWSKVFAAIICSVGGFILLVIYSLITTRTPFEFVTEFLSFKIALWVVLIIGAIVWLLYFISGPLKRNTTSIPSDLKVLLDLSNIGEHDVVLERLPVDNSKDAEGTYSIENGVLNLLRMNNEGRFLIRFTRYETDNQSVHFIRKNILLESNRRLHVSFKAKVTGGAHTFRVICRKNDIPQWVHNAFVSFKIQSNAYQPYKSIIYVPTDQDFQLQVDDLYVENAGSSIQVKEFKVVEFI